MEPNRLVDQDNSRAPILKILKEEIPKMHELLSIARSRYTEESIVENSEAILNLVTSLRGIIKDMVVLSENDKILIRVDNLILRPLITSLLRSLTEALNDLKTEIKRGSDLENASTALLTGIGSKLSLEYARSIQELEKILGL